MRVLASIPVFAAVASAQGSAWSQCGGIGWAGATSCVSGYTCTKLNDYYYQCIPGTTTAAPVTTTLKTSTVPTSIRSTIFDSSPSAPSATAVPSNPNPTVLQPGWYWIRAVAAPNFHKYLQSGTSSTASSNQTALLEDHTTAGQFNIIDGQLVFNTKPSQLYLNVENPSDKTQRKLKTWFSTTKNAYGTFKFQGDTLTWSVADIKRPNEAAWLVCTGQEVFINTGAYLYQTPAGCADQTIHSYSGSTADL
ncbi:hypothetical protein N0V85_005384 [Neurospora sp. IMI 360204]|nr:hypothetical protein N0V85_005384 [Neurospora sp. IMI 360204]